MRGEYIKNNGNKKEKSKEESIGKKRKCFQTTDNEQKQEIRIGTWNVRSTYVEGALKQLTNEISRYKINILAIQETKQKGKFITEIENCIFFNSGGTTRMRGVGFMVPKDYKSVIKNFIALSERMCYIQIESGNKNLSILNVYAPTEEKEVEEKEIFYDELENAFKRMSRQDIKIVLGDCNAKIGKEEIYMPIIGRHSKHNNSNDNGKRIISFAAEMGLRIVSTNFAHKEIHKATWLAPNGRYSNQIDHVLIQSQYVKNVIDTRSYRGADADSDHFLVIMKMNQKWGIKKKPEKRKEIFLNVDELQEGRRRKKYMEEIEKYCEQIGNGSIDNSWKQIEDAMKTAAMKTISKGRKNKKVEWFDDKCRNEMRKRREAKEKMLQTGKEEDKRKYEEQRRKVKRICRNEKRKHIENKIKEIEQKFVNKEIKNFYQEVKRHKKGPQQKIHFIKDKNGQIITNEEEIVERWKEHFEGMLNEEKCNKERQREHEMETSQMEEIIPAPTLEEIKNIIMKLKNGKSSGENGVNSELIKYGGEELMKKIHTLIEEIWEKEVMPKSWETVVLIPIYKKGSKEECSNYRGIALLDTAYKIMAKHIQIKLKDCTEKSIGEYQCGFRGERSVIDHIFTVKQVQRMCYEYNVPIYAVFIDFKQAYDTINREKLFRVMEDLKVPRKLINLVKMTLSNVRTKVKFNGRMSDSFKIGKGLKQGDPLSTTLFNLILEWVVRRSGINRAGTLRNKSYQILAYADDVTILARTKEKLQEIGKRFRKAAGEVNLTINEIKSKYMKMDVTQKKQEKKEDLVIEMQGENNLKFEQVESYVYLGTVISENGEESKEIEARLIKGDKCAGALNKIIRSKNVSRRAKLHLYKTVIRPTALYGSETWILNKAEENKIDIWERKILRRIYGGKKDGEVWIRRTNEEVMNLYREPPISQVVKATRLRWLGHLERMSEERTAKMMKNIDMGGTKKKGRPRKRWYEEVQKDLRGKGIQNWRAKARDRKKWKDITKLWA